MPAAGAIIAAVATITAAKMQSDAQKRASATQREIAQMNKPTSLPPEKAARAPGVAAFRRQNANAAAPGGVLAGNSSTLLTGPTGLAPGSTNLGKSLLLGE